MHINNLRHIYYKFNSLNIQTIELILFQYHSIQILVILKSSSQKTVKEEDRFLIKFKIIKIINT